MSKEVGFWFKLLCNATMGIFMHITLYNLDTSLYKGIGGPLPSRSDSRRVQNDNGNPHTYDIIPCKLMVINYWQKPKIFSIPNACVIINCKDATYQNKPSPLTWWNRYLTISLHFYVQKSLRFEIRYIGTLLNESKSAIQNTFIHMYLRSLCKKLLHS